MDETAPDRDATWTSDGLGRPEAIHHWRDWFSRRPEAPVEVSVYSAVEFDGYLSSRGIGQLRMLHVRAPAQKVVHRAVESRPAPADHLIHLMYIVEGTIDAHADARQFHVEAGQFVLVDNCRFFELDCTAHEVIDLIMPRPWLELHLPEPLALLGQPLSMRSGWAPPLGTLLETIAAQDEDCPIPRTLLAEQLGNLIALAVGVREPSNHRPTVKLAQRVMRRIEHDFSDTELTPETVAADLKISKRYLQSLLASAGTSFVRELNAVRLDRASSLLIDPRTRDLPVSEIAYRCGYLDPGYFARQFRKRFNATPRGWRAMN